MSVSPSACLPASRSKSMVMGDVSRGPCRPSSPSLQEGALKAGWLKKQRSIMKNWQLKWFVLRSDQLYFYKDEEETKPQGCIPLQGCQVNELTANPEEPGRHLFEIVPAAISHEAILLLANSQSDMDDWVKAIRRVIWAPFGGGIFGQSLEDTVQYEKKFGHRLAPLLVEQCVDFIRERGLDEEGLFRMSGQTNLVKDLQEAFDCGDKPLFDSNTDVHTVASLLKLYLRELPEPVVPFSKYEDFLACAQLLAKDAEGVQELGKQVSNLPPANYNLLKYICKFLDEVQSHAIKNKMSVQNLATVFGPNILRPKMEDPVVIMEGTSLVQSLMTVLISEHKRLYSGRGELEVPVPQSEVTLQGQQLQQHSIGGWISEEDLQSCPTNPNEDLACSSASSLDAKLCAATTPPLRLAPSGKGETVVSPSKQTKNVPSWKYSFKGSSTQRPPPQAKPAVCAADVGASYSGNWLMNGLSSLRSHRRTTSGERVRDSTSSSQRLSTYDNVTSSSSMGSVPSVASTPWSTSSCEIAAPDSGSEPSGPNCGNGKGPGECQWQELPALQLCKSTYVCTPCRLEESSAALCAQMERLEQEMEQERKKQRMLEIKLRNSDRGRHDAENRNRLLEREMEDFFSTLGDLTLGARTSNI
uniref:Rho GTPase activating protein 22 n=1 Tax=Oncorhynchus tshawytscha TaxID=74940 RepID=A0A8C8EZT4_ONCTS